MSRYDPESDTEETSTPNNTGNESARAASSGDASWQDDEGTQAASDPESRWPAMLTMLKPVDSQNNAIEAEDTSDQWGINIVQSALMGAIKKQLKSAFASHKTEMDVALQEQVAVTPPFFHEPNPVHHAPR